MRIVKLIVKNFKSLRDSTIEFNPHLNIIVGDNETGKSTLLEAIHLVLSSQINGRSIQNELTPYLFNDDVVNEYLSTTKGGRKLPPPGIVIEAYLDDDVELAKFKGTNNSLREDCPGARLSIEVNDELTDQFNEYIRSPEPIHILPIEYYTIKWYSFAGNPLFAKNFPLTPTYIDTSQIRLGIGTDRYIAKIIDDNLSSKERADLSAIYRKMKDLFGNEKGVQSINSSLTSKKGDITDKDLSVSMDMSAHSTWESSLTLHLDDIPFMLAGKGEQSSVKMKLAMESSSQAHVY
jgi:energy-coupling factor transporter ATP-binding protein EcfA2